MKKMRLKMKRAVTGLAWVLASAIPGSAAVIHVPADYPTIQAAVDAAVSGDEIQIAAGVYTNQVVIANKNLTLFGSPGAVLRATPGMQQSLIPVSGVVSIDTPILGVFKSEVVVSGLTFDGERLADSQPGGLKGIWFLAAGGRVEDCHFQGFRGESLDSTYGGCAVDVENVLGFGFGSVNIQVLRSSFADNYESIRVTGDLPAGPRAVWHPELLATKFVVNDNIIVGSGPDPTGIQHGIVIYPGAGGEVKSNIITDLAYTGTTDFPPISFGILAFDRVDFDQGTPLVALQPVHFEGNILLNNQVDLALIYGDGSTIVNNSFGGTAPGSRPGGLYFSGDNVKVVANRFDHMETGILLLGEDYQFGTYFGITSNANVVANQFCGVLDPICSEKLVTGTVEDGNNFDACQ